MRLFHIVIVGALLFGATPGRAASAAQATKPVDLSGRWRVSVTFDQGTIPGTFDLKQEGEFVKGRFSATFTGGDVPVEGDFSHGKLTMSGSTTGGPHPGEQLDFTIDVRTEDAMSGTLSWSPGNFVLSAERIK